MKKLYRYEGPVSVATLYFVKDGKRAAERVRFFYGAELALDPTNTVVLSLIARGHLREVLPLVPAPELAPGSAGDAAPAAAASPASSDADKPTPGDEERPLEEAHVEAPALDGDEPADEPAPETAPAPSAEDSPMATSASDAGATSTTAAPRGKKGSR